MSRFLLSPGATTDLEELARYLRGLPKQPGIKIGKAIQQTLHELAARPEMGRIRSDLKVASGETVRSFPMKKYVFLYLADHRPVEFLGVIHAKRDVDSIMRSRLG